MGEHQGDGLGALVLEGGEQGALIRLIHKGKLPVLEGLGDLAQELLGGLGPVGLLQDGSGVFQAALGDRLVAQAHLIELGQDLFGLLGAQQAQLCHLNGELLHVVGLHELVQVGGLIGPQGDDNGCCLLLAVQAHPGHRRGRLGLRLFGLGLLLDFLGLLGLFALLALFALPKALFLGLRCGVSHCRRLLSASS